MKQLRHKIGQMLMMGFSGYELNAKSEVVQWLKQDGLGGVLLFDYDLPNQCHGKNLRDKAQIKQLTSQLQTYAQDDHEIPLFIAIDYEGGAVDRLAKIDGLLKTKTALEVAQLEEKSRALLFKNMAETLHSLGFNLNFAPVVDIHQPGKSDIIGTLGRSFSDSPEIIASIAAQFVEISSQSGILSCYKHFPGHGSAEGDTHLGFVDVSNTFSAKELQPYQLLARKTEDQAMIMTAHVINRALDAEGLPATLSYPILTQLLRETMGYNGVIISDDLQMKAISAHYSIDDALQLTIQAGADMVIFGNQWGSISAIEVIDRIDALVQRGKIKEARIEEAYQRIVTLKASIKQQSRVAVSAF